MECFGAPGLRPNWSLHTKMSGVLVKGRLWATEKALDLRAIGEVRSELIFVTPWAALQEEIRVSLRLLQASWPNSMDVWAARSQRSLAKPLTRAHNYKQRVMNIFALLSMLGCVCLRAEDLQVELTSQRIYTLNFREPPYSP